MKRKRILSSAVGLALTAAWVVAAGIFIVGCTGAKSQSAEEKVQASAADLRETLRDAVKDAGRLQQMLVLTDQAAADLQAGAAELARLREEQVRLNGDYDASRSEFQQLGERLQAVRMEYRFKVLGARQALAHWATDDEWKNITSRDLAILGN